MCNLSSVNGVGFLLTLYTDTSFCKGRDFCNYPNECWVAFQLDEVVLVTRCGCVKVWMPVMGLGGDYLGRDLGPYIYDIGLKIMMLFQVMGRCLILEPLRSLSRLFTDMKTAGNILVCFSLFS